MKTKGTKYIVRKRALGDVLWIEPLIEVLSNRYRKLIVVTKFNDLFLNYPLTNVFFKTDLSFLEKVWYQFERLFGLNYLFVDLEMSYEKIPKIHFLHAYQQIAKIPLTRQYPTLYLSNLEKDDCKEFGKYIILHITSFSSKNYRKVFGIEWNIIVAFCNQHGYKVFVVGDNEKKLANTITYNKSIRNLISLIYNCSLFIGIDSGPSHIATTLRRPAIIFFGAVNPSYRHFLDLIQERTIVMQSDCEFAGCYHEVRNNIYGQTCQLVGNEGVPKCSLHSSNQLLLNIQKLIPIHGID